MVTALVTGALYPIILQFFVCSISYEGLITAWTQRTWAGMREEYLNSGEERIVLPDDTKGGLVMYITTRIFSHLMLQLTHLILTMLREDFICLELVLQSALLSMFL